MKGKLKGKRFQNRNELKEELLKIWKEIPAEFLKKLIGSIESRIRAVLLAKGGGHTLY
jgi:hypothetical protein